jgi:hypothetical protein
VLLVTVLVTVSVLALDVSVAGLVVSVFTVVSVLLFDDESVLAESDDPPDLFPLQAATDNEMVMAKRDNLNAFFMIVFFNVLMVNRFVKEKFGGSD